MVAIAGALAYSSQSTDPKTTTTATWPDFADSTKTPTWIADLLPCTVYRQVFSQHYRKSSQTWSMVKFALRISSENISEELPNAPHDAPRSESRAPEYSIWQMPQGYNLGQDTTNMILNPTHHQYPPSAWGDAARHLDAFLHVQRIGLAHLTGSNPHNNTIHTTIQNTRAVKPNTNHAKTIKRRSKSPQPSDTRRASSRRTR